ncbi:hypothetical protein [Brevundimonas sp. SGAir0440]|uniref:hypothetical protein n=1 Tax=Brevundimonas sp. SGAir0440 TaxID=2579977 RepID=UPI0010CCBE7D|nr:hypothetical protein [Brevundimonas sp. SGAir0440]QCQ98028.1 hypothetical protein E7T10_04780 [Brevundimonas sp. SGAir0440]
MTRAAWAEAIGAELDDAGLPTIETVVGHIRAAAAVEPYLLRSRITRALKESYSPFGGEDGDLGPLIHQGCDILVRLGDLTAFQSDGGLGYVATPERLVELDADRVVVLGMSAGSATPVTGLVRRLSRDTAIETISAPLVGLADELGPPEWRLHILALGGMDERTGGPGGLFTRLAGAAASGERLDRAEPAALRVLSKRGPYFGKAQVVAGDGRWTGLLGEGAFCASRRKTYSWQNCVISASAQGVRAVDVTNLDRWRWAVVGQTRLAGDPVFDWHDGQLQCFTPPPFQLQRLLDLSGDNVGPWKWAVSQTAADLAEQLTA